MPATTRYEATTTEADSELLATAIRLHLERHFKGEVILDRVLPGDQFCVLEHSNGTRGLVPVAAVVMMEARP